MASVFGQVQVERWNAPLVQNRLRWHVHEFDAELQVPAGAMDQTVWLDQISLLLDQQPVRCLRC